MLIIFNKPNQQIST